MPKTLWVAGLRLVLGLILVAGGETRADPLENMERERARLIGALLDPGSDPAGRSETAEIARRRLIDLERIALRDPRTAADTRPIARRAFADYDLTFLAHASIELDRAVLDLWLERIGISTARVMAARMGRR
ncbi:hypothetical protein [Thalassobaculum litoreum]|uniref:Uncharacterized protein n=1 Tax=Thalassobaculum litoreum DSM 18839 TaxID=1123362 RepID=A0A8G2BIC8_9PROT|nr:hypothetical protein [Thalassobaculum litoreum]SDF87090.1 hypothetical protein SAMN05660686_02627 [Thalassobaculum litoreum DSM 18839]